MEKCATQRARFLGFAGGHFVVCAISVAFLAFAALGGIWPWVLAAGLMLLYLPAGAGAAVLLSWSRPSPGAWRRSVLWASLAAWVWGFGGWSGLWLGAALEWELLFSLCFWALLSTLFLATPSFVWMACTLGTLESLPSGGTPLWYGAIALAGFLPALLFHLGALAGSDFRPKRAAGGPEGPVPGQKRPQNGPGAGPMGGRVWLFAAGSAAVLALSLTACGGQEPQASISEALDLDVAAGETCSYTDSHGGFHGDGTTCAVLRFPNDRVMTQIQEDPRWSPFPLDETVRALVYGLSWERDREAFHVGPYLTDEEGETLVLDIQNGYYRLMDRHAERDAPGDPGILGRASFNFTLGIYDADEDLLYFCQMDT